MVTAVGRWMIETTMVVGRFSLFVWLIVRVAPRFKGFFSLCVRQLFVIGVLSLPIILVAGLFVGMVVGLQGYYILVDFGAEDALGTMVALSLVRQLGPVLTAILFAGRAGSALATEIGLMRVTQQLDALEMMAIDPVNRILQPRLLSGILVVPALNIIFIAVGLFGGWLVGSVLLGVDSGTFWSQMQYRVDWYEDVVNGVIKSVVFGVLATLIALFFGYYAKATVEGTSIATTKTVVYTSLVVLGCNLVLTAVMY